MITLRVNGAARTVDVPPETPLLWVLRETLGLTGTKFGCGVGLCGTCTVHLDGVPARSCTTSVAAVRDRAVTTIEGVAAAGAGTAVADARRGLVAAAVLEAWTARDVAQCGYCQPGMVMAAVALLITTATPTDADIDRAFAGQLCRCGTYQRLRAAVHDAARALGAG